MKNNDKRVLTLVVELQGSEGNWVWDAHMKGPVNGLRIKSISEGDSVEKLEEAYAEIEERDWENFDE